MKVRDHSLENKVVGIYKETTLPCSRQNNCNRLLFASESSSLKTYRQNKARLFFWELQRYRILKFSALCLHMLVWKHDIGFTGCVHTVTAGCFWKNPQAFAAGSVVSPFKVLWTIILYDLTIQVFFFFFLKDNCFMERGGEGEMYGKSNMETYITICKIDSQWEFAVWLRKLKQGLCICSSLLRQFVLRC